MSVSVLMPEGDGSPPSASRQRGAIRRKLDTAPGHVVVPAGGVLVPDSHHQALALQHQLLVVAQ